MADPVRENHGDVARSERGIGPATGWCGTSGLYSPPRTTSCRPSRPRKENYTVRLRQALFGLLILVVSMMTLAPLSATPASAAPPGQTTNTNRAVPIAGTLDNGNLFAGTFNLQQFAAQNGQLVATGTVSG